MQPMTFLKQKRTELLANQMSNLVSDSNENLLRINLSKFFTDLEHDVQNALFEYYNNDLKQGQLNLILSSIHERHQEYYELIMRHKINEFRRSRRTATLMVFNARQKYAFKSENPVTFTANTQNLFGTLSYTENELATKTFTASEGTLARVDSNINEILTDGYKGGKGINEVSRQITERFDQLRTWESSRIARTEIHGAQNEGIMSAYEELGVEYIQWIAAGDDRTRDSHVLIDREIIRFGDMFSNLLEFPGDTSGDIGEWINCRCSVAPFIMPPGMTAPAGMEQFYESDLVPINEVQENQAFDPDLPFQPNNDLLKGDYEVYYDRDMQGKPIKVYKFEKIELAFSEFSNIQFEELRDHINSLPKIFETTHAKRIEFYDYEHPRRAGVWHPDTKVIGVHMSSYHTVVKSRRLDTFNHELAHSIDIPGFNKNRTDWEYTLSHPSNYHKIFWADNSLLELAVKIENDVPLHFPTPYSGNSYIEFIKNLDRQYRIFSEDFAESTMRYLNPATYETFCREFPNRAAYLKDLYGVPDFANSGFSKFKSSEIKVKNPPSKEQIQSWYTKHYTDMAWEIYEERQDIMTDIQYLKDERRKLRKKRIRCENDACTEKYNNMIDELNEEMKDLESYENDMFNLWSDLLDKSRVKIFK